MGISYAGFRHLFLFKFTSPKGTMKRGARLMYNCAHLRSTKESLTIEYLRVIFFVVEKKNVLGKLD